jgi:transglutaminase-like putative cysteine protease
MRLATFTALAALCTVQWLALVASPPAARVALAIAIVIAGAALLVLAHGGPARRRILAVGAMLAAVAGALAVVGLPVRLLLPGGWPELADGIGSGFSGLSGAEYPYSSGERWSRLVLLLAVPAVVALAAVIAFWPRASERSPRSALPLGLLLAMYVTSVAARGVDASLLDGLVLLALIGCWLWAPGVRRTEALRAGVLIAAAGAVAAPAALALDAEDPWIDYQSWSFSKGDGPVGFDWNHSYEPLEWPRDGRLMFEVESDSPHYWRATVLETFDTDGWRRTGSTEPVEGRVLAGLDDERDEWLEEATVTIGALRGEFVVGPGELRRVTGIEAEPTTDGSMLADEAPEQGDSYSIVGYAPDPSADEMRATSIPHAPELKHYTTMWLESRTRLPLDINGEPDFVIRVGPRALPLRGSRGHRRERGAGAVAEAGYGQVYRLARDLTDDAPTTYDAVKAVERHFETGFEYTEAPPQREAPLRAFLLRDRVGYCQQFSGAMALMLRMAGIPSRVVAGFSPGAPDRDRDGVYQVRDLDAHSWVEVYFPGIGWVPFDPTPTAAPAESQSGSLGASAAPGSINPGEESGGRSAPEVRSSGGRAAESANAPGWVVPSVLAALLALAGGAVAVRSVRFRGLEAGAALAAQLAEIERALPKLGWRVPPGATLQQMEGRLRTTSRPAAARYLATLRRNRFAKPAPEPASAGERRATRRELASSRAGAGGGRLRALLALPPGGPRAIR